jgi:hypothetical protein
LTILDQLSEEPTPVFSGAEAGASTPLMERILAALSSRSISSASNMAPMQIAESATLNVGQL